MTFEATILSTALRQIWQTLKIQQASITERRSGTSVLIQYSTNISQCNIPKICGSNYRVNQGPGDNDGVLNAIKKPFKGMENYRRL
jgi:hypothetical protein